MISVPSYSYKNVDHESGQYVVFTPVLEKLVRSYTVAVLNDQWADGANVYFQTLTLKYGYHSFFSSTLEAFIHLVHSGQVDLKSRSKVVRMIANAELDILPADAGMVSFPLVKTGLSVREGLPVRIESREDLSPLDYIPRSDVKITAHNGAQVVNGRMMFSDRTREKPFIRTAYFRFSGVHQPDFIEYTNSPNNLEGGLKRTIGARPDEDRIRATGILTANAFVRALEDNQWDPTFDKVRDLDMSFNAEHAFLMCLGKRSMTTISRDGVMRELHEARQHVARQQVRLVKRSSRSQIRRWRDAGLSLIHI